MKRLSTTGIDNQINKLSDTSSRLVKINTEFVELSRRDWKGGDMPVAAQTRRVVQELDAALEKIKIAREEVRSLHAMVARRRR